MTNDKAVSRIREIASRAILDNWEAFEPDVLPSGPTRELWQALLAIEEAAFGAAQESACEDIDVYLDVEDFNDG